MPDFNFSALIDSLNPQIAGAAKTNADFSQIANLAPSYWKGLEQAYTQGQREAFKNGMPLDKDGNPDFNKVTDVLLKKQGIPGLQTAIGLQDLLFGQKVQQQRALGPGFAQPQGEVSSLPPNTSPGAVRPTGAPVQPQAPDSPRYVSPQEGERTGIYGPPPADPNNPDAPQRVAQTQPQAQPTPVPTVSYTPNNPRGVPTEQPIQPGQRIGTPFDDMRKISGPNWDPAEKLTWLRQILGTGRIKGPQAEDIKNEIVTLEKAISTAIAPTEETKNYWQFVKQNPTANLTKEQWLEKNKQQDADRDVRKSVETKSADVAIERVKTSFDKADAAAKDMEVTKDLRDQLNAKKGIFVGQWAEDKLALAKIASAVGLNIQADKIPPTEVFMAQVGQRVASLVKNFGSGTSITDADREFAKKMAGGNIKLDETSIRKILDLSDRMNGELIKRHNTLVDRLSAARPEAASTVSVFRVRTPSQFTKGQTATNPQTQQKMVFDGSAWVPVK